MAELNLKNLTLSDYAKRQDPTGKIDKIVDLMKVLGADELINEMVVKPTNGDLDETTTIQTGLPTVATAQFGKGWTASKSAVAQEKFATGMFQSRGQVDCRLIDGLADGKALRLSENGPTFEAMYQKLATTMFYGNQASVKEEFTGLAPYYSSTTAKTARNLILAGGVGSDNTSIYLVVWGENTVYGTFPKAMTAGIKHEDMGKHLVEDGFTAGNTLWSYIDEYQAALGLVVKNWKYAGRIANIDLSDLETAGDTTDNSANIIKMMLMLKNRVPNINGGKAVWYMNTDVKSMLEVKLMDKTQSQLTYKTLENGETVLACLGIPIRRCDSITNAETLVA